MSDYWATSGGHDLWYGMIRAIDDQTAAIKKQTTAIDAQTAAIKEQTTLLRANLLTARNITDDYDPVVVTERDPADDNTEEEWANIRATAQWQDPLDADKAHGEF